MIVYMLMLKERISRKTNPKISYPITFLSVCFKSPSINSTFDSDSEYLYKCSELFLGAHRYQFSKFKEIHKILSFDIFIESNIHTGFYRRHRN